MKAICDNCGQEKPNVGRWRQKGKPVSMWCGGCKLGHSLSSREVLDRLEEDASQRFGLNVVIEVQSIH